MQLPPTSNPHPVEDNDDRIVVMGDMIPKALIPLIRYNLKSIDAQKD